MGARWWKLNLLTASIAAVGIQVVEFTFAEMNVNMVPGAGSVTIAVAQALRDAVSVLGFPPVTVRHVLGQRAPALGISHRLKR